MIFKSGFYRIDGTATDLPTSGSVYYLLHVQNPVNEGFGFQIASTSSGGAFAYIRAKSATWGSWQKLWNAANDGSGSGLDADLLDGQHGSYYAPLASPALTGTPTAPTPATETNNTQIATTAFVKNQKYEPNRGTGANSLALGYNSEASGNYSTALGVSSAASGSHSTAIGTNSEASVARSLALGNGAIASGYGSIALGYNVEASGADSIALGVNSEASGVDSIALGWGSRAIGKDSIALGIEARAIGEDSIAIGGRSTATGDYQITIGTKFVYLRCASTDTEATVYDALSPWVNPTAFSSQGAMGSFGNTDVISLSRTVDTIILQNDRNNIKEIGLGRTNRICSNLAICTVKY